MGKNLTIQTQQHKQVIDLTEQINAVIETSGVKSGLCHIFARHTTVAISVADLDAGGTDLDYLEAFEKIVPALNYRHPHDPSHMPDHILSTGIGPWATLPVSSGALDLGAWQRVVLFEFDGPRTRELVVTIISNN
jgi:secondary thiamine-phosphate synthase enzyme